MNPNDFSHWDWQGIVARKQRRRHVFWSGVRKWAFPIGLILAALLMGWPFHG